MSARSITVAAAVVASAVLTTVVWRRNRPEDPFSFTDPGVFETVAAERRAAERPSGRGVESRPYYLSEDHARVLFKGRRNKVYDPWVYFRDRPNRSLRVEWPEHPAGYFEVKTNSLGFRDDEPVADPDFEVCVVGDSNTAGVCNLDETYSNRLEQLLAEARPEETVSVVNMGTGGYGFYNYLGAVEKNVVRGPDAFVVTIFGGNDFSGILGLNRIFEDGPPHSWPKEAAIRRRDALEIDRVLMTHCYNSDMIFETFPDHVDVAVDVALKLAGKMKAACDEHGVRLVVLYIPEPCSFDWDPPIEKAAAMRDVLGLDDDCGRSSGIANRFLEGLAVIGVPTVDMRPVFGDLPSPPYWRADLHMNLEAHELTARALFERIR